MRVNFPAHSTDITVRPAHGKIRRDLTGMKAKLAPQFRVIPVKWEKENPIELPVMAREQAPHAKSRTICLLRELESRASSTLNAPRHFSSRS